MRCEWSVQRARRVTICAVLAMHVRCDAFSPIHPGSLFTGKKRKCLLVCSRSVKVGLLKTLRLVYKSQQGCFAFALLRHSHDAW